MFAMKCELLFAASGDMGNLNEEEKFWNTFATDNVTKISTKTNLGAVGYPINCNKFIIVTKFRGGST